MKRTSWISNNTFTNLTSLIIIIIGINNIPGNIIYSAMLMNNKGNWLVDNSFTTANLAKWIIWEISLLTRKRISAHRLTVLLLCKWMSLAPTSAWKAMAKILSNSTFRNRRNNRLQGSFRRGIWPSNENRRQWPRLSPDSPDPHPNSTKSKLI